MNRPIADGLTIQRKTAIDGQKPKLDATWRNMASVPTKYAEANRLWELALIWMHDANMAKRDGISVQMINKVGSQAVAEHHLNLYFDLLDEIANEQSITKKD